MVSKTTVSVNSTSLESFRSLFRVASRFAVLLFVLLVCVTAVTAEGRKYGLFVMGDAEAEASGLFTKTMLNELGSGAKQLTYSELIARVQPKVVKTASAHNNVQTPQLDARFGDANAKVFSTQSSVARRLALLVGISDYDKGTNPADQWSPLSTGPDLVNMSYVLQQYYGFQKPGLRLLENEQATQENVTRVFRQHLVANAKPGDRILFYYTGHGFHLPDTSGDETADREDEATVMWVPKDKQSLAPERRRALMYMLDDTYQVLLKELSQKMRGADGKVQGSITVIFDSCHSGSAAKAALIPKGRLWREEIDGPRPSAFVPSQVASGWLTLGKDQLENVAFIAGSRSDQFSYMMPDSEKDGSILTYYLSEFLTNIALNKPDRKVTYKDMLQGVDPKVVAIGNTQNPQVEGNVLAEIFGDGEPLNLHNVPIVRRVQANPLRVELGVGSLHGISAGSRFDLYRRNTDIKNPANKLAELELIAVQSITSVGTISKPSSSSIQPADYEAAQAVLTEQRFHGPPLKVLIPSRLSPDTPIPQDKLNLLSGAVAREPFVSTTDATEEKFDVRLGWCPDDKLDICKGNGGKFFYQRANGSVSSLGTTIDVPGLKKRLLTHWRWKSFAELTLPGSPKVHIEIVGKDGQPLRSQGGRIILKPGDEGKVRVINNTGERVFITLLYLKDSGDIEVFPGPREANGQEKIDASDKPHGLFDFADVTATHIEVEILKIIATPEPADFVPISFDEEGRKGIKNKGPQNPLDELLFGIIDAKTKSIGIKRSALDRWYTDQIVLEIHPN